MACASQCSRRWNQHGTATHRCYQCRLRRGYGHENVLTEITVDQHTLDILNKKNYTLDTVIAKDEILYLKSTANLSTGGTSRDVTDLVHPENVFLFERISRVIGLDICGVDIMAPNLTEPLSKRWCRARSQCRPGIPYAPRTYRRSPTQCRCTRFGYALSNRHLQPHTHHRYHGNQWQDHNHTPHLSYRKKQWLPCSFTTSDGIYVQNTMLEKATAQDLGVQSLYSRTLEFAVLECRRILRSQLGICCDIAVVTNIQEDHLGLSDINSLEDLARVKSVVVDSVKSNGWAVLNAEDPWCVKIAEQLRCNVAFFSMDENHPVIVEHSKKNGISAVYENGFVTVKKGDWKMRLDKASHFPITFNGKASFNGTVSPPLAAYLQGFKLQDIRLTMETFVPSAAQTPGRMNIFEFKEFKVMIDFAQNPHGYRAVKDFIEKIDATKKERYHIWSRRPT